MINFNVKSIANNKRSEKTLDKPFPTVDIQGRNSNILRTVLFFVFLL